MGSDEGTALLGAGGSTTPVAAPEPSHRAISLGMVTSMIAMTARRMRRRAELIGEARSTAGPPTPHTPMSTWGSFLFLSNLICGPGMLGLPVAFRYSGALVAGGMTCMFAIVSALACVFIAHVCRLYRTSVRCARAAAPAARGSVQRKSAKRARRRTSCGCA
jgi:hypothetical protein